MTSLPVTAKLIYVKQVCLMSQSWDNVASMHDYVFNNSTCSGLLTGMTKNRALPLEALWLAPAPA